MKRNAFIMKASGNNLPKFKRTFKYKVTFCLIVTQNKNFKNRLISSINKLKIF